MRRKGLAQKRRQEPEPQQGGGAEEDRNHRRGDVDGEEQAGFPRHRVPRRPRDESVAVQTGGVDQQRAYLADRVGAAANMPGEAGLRARQRPGQLGVTGGIVGVAVMVHVEMLKPDRRQQIDKPGAPGRRRIEPGAAERRLVHRLMLQAEQEDQQDAVERQQDRPAGRPGRNEGPGDPQRRQMAGKVKKALEIGAPQQAAPLLAAQPADNIAMIRCPARRSVYVHRSLSDSPAGLEAPAGCGKPYHGGNNLGKSVTDPGHRAV